VKPEGDQPERSPSPAPSDTAPHPAEASLWEQFLARENLAEALRRVEQNAGAAGIDGMSTKELRPWLHRHWPEVRSQLEAGTYRITVYSEVGGDVADWVMHAAVLEVEPGDYFGTGRGNNEGQGQFLVPHEWSVEV